MRLRLDMKNGVAKIIKPGQDIGGTFPLWDKTVFTEQTIDISLLKNFQGWYVADIFKQAARRKRFPFIFKVGVVEYKIDVDIKGKIKIKKG